MSSGFDHVCSSASSAEFFEESWALYATILQHNYMFHNEIYRNVRELVASRFGSKAFSVLDLGCGDARHLAAAIDGLPVSRYVGYDLSTVALEQAARNLGCVAAATLELKQGDLSEVVRSEKACFDIVFSGFAVHHLRTEQKADFFRAVRDRVKDAGLLILVDVMRDEAEDRARYIDRYCAWAESSWSSIVPSGLAQVCAHIRDKDFPERPSDLIRMAEGAGFGATQVLPSFLFHHTLAWTPAHAVEIAK